MRNRNLSESILFRYYYPLPPGSGYPQSWPKGDPLIQASPSTDDRYSYNQNPFFRNRHAPVRITFTALQGKYKPQPVPQREVQPQPNFIIDSETRLQVQLDLSRAPSPRNASDCGCRKRGNNTTRRSSAQTLDSQQQTKSLNSAM